MALEKWYIDVQHDCLGTFKRISGTDRYVVQARAEAQRAQWEKRWEREQLASQKAHARLDQQRSREAERAYRESRKEEAETLTQAAQDVHDALRGVLNHTLSVDDRIDFESLKSHEPFSEAEPRPPKYKPLRARPEAFTRAFVADPLGFLARLWELLWPPARRARQQRERDGEARLLAEDNSAHSTALDAWTAESTRIDGMNAARRQEYEAALSDHHQRRALYESDQHDRNARIDDLRARYERQEPDAVEQYCDLVLSRSEYPDCLPQTSQLRYVAETRMLVIEYRLPAPDDIPRAKSFKYVTTRDEMVQQDITDKEFRSLYDSIVCQIAIRTLHEVIEADTVGALDGVALNGIVETVDRSTGKDIRPCIISLSVKKAELEALNLAAVEPRACVKRLKGVCASELVALTPIPPLVPYDTNDSRFVDARDVMSSLDEGMNLATMKWEDFEHLVRQLLDVEFGSVGGEVKVTQSSRDGGVDAVIFDSDPLRGGKFIVQAKRYTRVVPVASVRDLYGTMLNEKAGKAILVTTATFGPDSYAFAREKPITLIDGSSLLHLMQQHGMRAHIDAEVARRARGAAPARRS